MTLQGVFAASFFFSSLQIFASAPETSGENLIIGSMAKESWRQRKNCPSSVLPLLFCRKKTVSFHKKRVFEGVIM